MVALYAPYRKVVRVDPIRPGWGNVIGNIVPVALECGHVIQGNQTMTWRVGEAVPCHACKKAPRWPHET